MALWNRKRARPRRVDRLLPEGDVAWHERLRMPRVLWQLAVAAAFALGALAIIQAPHPPLPYRKGEKTVHPIIARVDFEYIDHQVTADVRELTALFQVPGHYTPDARQIIALRESLLTLVADAAKAPTLDDLPKATREAWKVDEPMFAAIKAALDTGGEMPDPAAVQEKITQATALLAKPRDLPIVREDDYQRASARIARFRELRSGLPAGLSPDRAPILKEPAPEIIVQLPEGDETLPLASVLTATQTDRIQTRLQRTLEPALKPVFGEPGLATLVSLMAPQVGPTLAYDSAKTENRRADVRKGVEPAPILRKAGTTLVEAGKEISEADLAVLEQEQARRLAGLGIVRRALGWLGILAVLAALTLVLILYTTRFRLEVTRRVSRSVLLAALGLLVVGGAKMVAQGQGPLALATAIVLAAGMIVTIAYSTRFALATTWAMVLMAALATRAPLDWVMVTLVGSGVAVLMLGSISHRSRLIRVGAVSGLVSFVAAAGLDLWRLESGDDVLAIPGHLLLPNLVGYGGAGVAAGIVMLALLPFIERLFGIVTNISLLELCDVNQPALKRLALEAPGTYAHSLLIGTLAEAAASAIGANGLLARVGAYFHDIGKANKPRYFVENYLEGEEAHGGLAPTMSRLIIMSHVKDGLEMADRLGLPPVIKQFIVEHHGTTLMEYFYHEALRQAEAAGEDPPDKADYRYPGPKPRCPETGIVMIADAVEGATRSLKERTAGKIAGAVHDMVMRRLLDGQLDDSGLTMNDLHTIEETLTKTLLSVYHGRVAYPATGDAAAEGGAGGERPSGGNGARGPGATDPGQT
jgi:hypothetical protein